jgi:8-oxo-dGTP pyrophosphatase MutT (NUDIX family)
VVKEATASVYVFRRSGAGEWLLGLMLHPRFGEWLTPGGHVEADESPAEAAVRETAEELGCEVRLLPGPSMPRPAGCPHPHMAPPWWIVEMAASPDNHTASHHFHLDHVFAGPYMGRVREPETQVRWMSEQELAQTPSVPEDVRLPAKQLFGEISRLAGSESTAQPAVEPQQSWRQIVAADERFETGPRSQLSGIDGAPSVAVYTKTLAKAIVF